MGSVHLAVGSRGGLGEERPIMRPTCDLFGVPVSAITMNAALELIDEAIASRQRLQIGVVNAAKLVNMQRNDELRADVLSSDLVLADGIAVVWASRILGRRLPERVTGIDLMTGMLAHGNELGYRVYCLGATPEILERTLARIKQDYPGVVIAGGHHGYFSREDEAAIAADIATSKPDILLIAMTSPMKERFLARWSRALDVPVCHGVGGSFDVMAGHVQRAPAVWQRLGLEWLYRVKQEPRRLWKRYLTTNSAFLMMVAAAVIRQQLARARPPAPSAGT
jgi:N-acetylglucosaminyldiphosphoundecaprenol N-acetyl-beta-D-mannosaminyltransferase